MTNTTNNTNQEMTAEEIISMARDFMNDAAAQLMANGIDKKEAMTRAIIAATTGLGAMGINRDASEHFYNYYMAKVNAS